MKNWEAKKLAPRKVGELPSMSSRTMTQCDVPSPNGASVAPCAQDPCRSRALLGHSVLHASYETKLNLIIVAYFICLLMLSLRFILSRTKSFSVNDLLSSRDVPPRNLERLSEEFRGKQAAP